MTATARSAPVVDAGVVVLGGLVATAVAWPIYQHPQAILVGVIGTLVGVTLAAAGRLLRLPWWTDALAAVAAYLLLAVPLAVGWLFPDRWLDGLRDAAFGVILGWKQLLTLDLPLGDYQAVLVPLLVVTLFGSYAATRLAGAGRAALVTPLILFAMAGFGIAFGTSEILSSAPVRWVPSIPILTELLGPVQLVHLLIVAVMLLLLLTVAWFAIRARQARRAALARAAGVAEARVRVHRGSAGAIARRGGLATAMLVVALAVAGAVALPTLELEREVLRDGMQPLELATPASSPLGAYRQWFQDERYDTELFAVEAGAGVERLRLVVLDDYDGTRFHVADPQGASRFTRVAGVGAAGSAAEPDGSGTTEVRIEIRDGYREPWLPLPGDLTSTARFPVDRERAIDLEDSIYYARDGSSAIVLDTDGGPGLRTGDAVVVAGATVAEARASIAAGTGGDPLHGVDQERFPELARWLDSQQPSAGGQGLLDVIDALRARGYLSHALVDAEDARWVADAAARVPDFEFKEARSGHSIARLEALFAQLTERQRQVVGATGVIQPGADETALVAAIGDDEQFAAAATLLAWALGFDARVVVGVHLVESDAMRPPGGGPPAVEACAAQGGQFVCAGRNAAAWIEVAIGDEWVPLDVSPQLQHLPQENREGERPPPHGTLPERPASGVIDPPNAAPAEGDPGAAPEDPPGVLPAQLAPALRIIALSVGATGLLLLPPAFLLSAKAIRRRQRRTRDPETSIVGAWDELVDLAVDHRVGGALVPGGTRRRLADRLGARIEGEEAARLAELADLAVFGDRTPVEAQADHAWELVAASHARLRDAVPFWERVRAALTPTSLIRRLSGAVAEHSQAREVRGGEPSERASRGPGGPGVIGSRSPGSRGVRLAGEVR